MGWPCAILVSYSWPSVYVTDCLQGIFVNDVVICCRPSFFFFLVSPQGLFSFYGHCFLLATALAKRPNLLSQVKPSLQHQLVVQRSSCSFFLQVLRFFPRSYISFSRSYFSSTDPTFLSPGPTFLPRSNFSSQVLNFFYKSYFPFPGSTFLLHVILFILPFLTSFATSLFRPPHLSLAVFQPFSQHQGTMVA